MRKGIGTMFIAGLVLLIGPSMGFTLRGAQHMGQQASSLLGAFILLVAAGIVIYDNKKKTEENKEAQPVQQDNFNENEE